MLSSLYFTLCLWAGAELDRPPPLPPPSLGDIATVRPLGDAARGEAGAIVCDVVFGFGIALALNAGISIDRVDMEDKSAVLSSLAERVDLLSVGETATVGARLTALEGTPRVPACACAKDGGKKVKSGEVAMRKNGEMECYRSEGMKDMRSEGLEMI
jgi:hypothetical protein